MVGTEDTKKTELKRFTFGDAHEPPEPPLAPADAEDDGCDWWVEFFNEQGIFAGHDQ